MDSDLSAEIARIEAELAQDAEMRQQQQQQQQASPPQQTAPQFQLAVDYPYSPKPAPQPQPQSLSQQQQQQQASPLNYNASPFVPQQNSQSPQDYFQQQQQPYTSGIVTGSQGSTSANSAAAAANMHSFSKDTDSRSVFVGNLPKGTEGGVTTTPEELVQFFSDCGSILNCTVLKDRAAGELKGTAYIEFADYTAMGKAIDTKNNANFKGSTIIVCVSLSQLLFT